MSVQALWACGSSSDNQSRDVSVTSTSVAATTPTAAPAPTPQATTTVPVASAGRSYTAILAAGLKLARDYSNEVRGIAGADEAKYRAQAQALLDEARVRGCPVPPGVEDFLR